MQVLDSSDIFEYIDEVKWELEHTYVLRMFTNIAQVCHCEFYLQASAKLLQQ
jgi:hypothetical protein